MPLSTEALDAREDNGKIHFNIFKYLYVNGTGLLGLP